LITPNIIDHMELLYDTVRRMPRPGALLEIGVEYATGSTWAFRAALEKRCIQEDVWVAVDMKDQRKPWCIPMHPGYKFVLGRSEAPETISQVSQIAQRFDIIFVDTHHTPEQVTLELDAYWPLQDRNTTWLFHDTYMNGVYNPMTDAIKDWCKSHDRQYADISTKCHGIGRILADNND
jgi:cephalosporin hydroxylase